MKDIVSINKYLDILSLQNKLNNQLLVCFTRNLDKGREKLADILIVKIDSLIEQLDKEGFHFIQSDYSGDINYENSEQTFSNDKKMGTGICLHFHGFTVQVYWVGNDKFYK